MASEVENPKSGCYCEKTVLGDHMLTCINCKKVFHISCLKSKIPSDLAGDIYFKFTCICCSTNGNEIFERMKLQWSTVLMLSFYNLQLQGGGKCGFFHRNAVCRFIDKNWMVFFGTDKRKSTSWQGTVAGCLSNFAGRYFISGFEILGDKGWWTLKSSKLPTLLEIEASVMSITKTCRKRKVEENIPIIVGPRRKNVNILDAAVSLKERNAYIGDDIQPKIKRKHTPKANMFRPDHKLKLVVPKVEPYSGDILREIPKIKTECSVPLRLSDDWTKTADDMDYGINHFSDKFDLSPLDSSNHFVLEDGFSDISCNKTNIKSSLKYESDKENNNSSAVTHSMKKVQNISTSKKKAITKDKNSIDETVLSEPKFTLMSSYQEEQLLMKLESYSNTMKERPEVRRLYRKLVVRKLKRGKNIPLFNVDAEARSIKGMDPPEYSEKENKNKMVTSNAISTILDRYQIYNYMRGKPHQYSSFMTRLMGLEEHDSTISPYTERILKPFIFRDYATKPQKLQLLEEIIFHANQRNRDFIPPKLSPIDYCYVRPQHIPAINALCKTFFWPRIDLSECLQYPDFSCVALYRKVIIGFAFMVPDVKYNEAYITFIFCHPDWRRAGIAKFMLYHLIQTCMGKDVTLHVSATSSAVLLYQKFGFKVEEFIHDFYDKYLPPDSRECRHALFMRLNR